MARPKGRQLPNRVSVALTDDQLAALERLARGSQAAVSWVVRRAVAEYLERNCTAELTDKSEMSLSPATE
jgi:predicted transcriptional regulator